MFLQITATLVIIMLLVALVNQHWGEKYANNNLLWILVAVLTMLGVWLA